MVKNPTFTNVVCTEKSPHEVKDSTEMYSFVDTYDPVELKTDGSELFLGDGDRLYKPLPSDSKMYGMRAYFRIQPAAHATSKPYYAIAFEDRMTGITLHQDKTSDSDRIYTLQGVSITADLNRLPSGIYIRNGKKIYICNQ